MQMDRMQPASPSPLHRLSDALPHLFDAARSFFSTGIPALNELFPESGLCCGDIIEIRAAAPSAVDQVRSKMISDVVVQFLRSSQHHCAEHTRSSSTTKKRAREGRHDTRFSPCNSTSLLPRVLYLSTRSSQVPVCTILRSCIEKHMHQPLPPAAGCCTTCQHNRNHHPSPSSQEALPPGGSLLYSQESDDDHASPPPHDARDDHCCRPSQSAAGEDHHNEELETLAKAAEHMFRLEVHEVESTSDIILALRSFTLPTPTSRRSVLTAPPPLLVVVDNLVDIFSHPSVQQPRGASTGPNFIIQDFGRSLRCFMADQHSFCGRPCAIVMLNALMGGGGSGGVSAAESLRRNLSRRPYGGTAWSAVPDVVLIGDDACLRRRSERIDDDDADANNGDHTRTLSSSIHRVLTITAVRGGRRIGDAVIL
jgi:hypothetical protein